MNIEYEYSFKVKSLEAFIKFIIDNNFKETSSFLEHRTLYKKSDKTMARVTIKECGNDKTTYLDFKDDDENDDILKERRESIPLKVDDIEATLSIIEFLDYKFSKELIRNRTVYNKSNVKFEVDSYEKPTKMFVVAIEGVKVDTDKVYNALKNKLFDQFIK